SRPEPLRPAGGLSARDVAWVRAFYPGDDDPELPELAPFQSRELAILPRQQPHPVLRHPAGDAARGEDRNATPQLKLFQGREYVVRVRLYFSQGSGETAVMMW